MRCSSGSVGGGFEDETGATDCCVGVDDGGCCSTITTITGRYVIVTVSTEVRLKTNFW